MSTTPTKLPVPSEKPQDFKFNAGKIDEFVTSMGWTYTDRFGQKHYTIEGINYLAQQVMNAFGYVTLMGVTFTTGATVNNPNEVLFNTADNSYYKWTGSFASGPKVVPENSTPQSSGGIGPGAWLSVGDTVLRNDLSSSSGYSFIGEFESVSALSGVIGSRDQALVSVKSFLSGRGIGGGQFRWMASSSLADDGFSVIKPSSVTGNGRWINVRRGRLTPQECGCIPDDATYDNAIFLNYWASQQHCCGSSGVFYSSDTVTFSGASPVNVTAADMTINITGNDKNGVAVSSGDSKEYYISGMKVVKNENATATIAASSNGFRISSVKRFTSFNCSAEGWSNSGIFLESVRQYHIEGFMGWKNDWDGSSQFASGGDIVVYTANQGESRGGLIHGCKLLSDASQNIYVNALSADRDIIISDNICDTYSNNSFEPKSLSTIKKRHCIIIGYLTSQVLGGGIIVSNNVLRSSNWTGVYRSGSSDKLYSPSKITGNQIYDVGLSVDSGGISGGILFGDLVPGDTVTDNTVYNFKWSASASFRFSDTDGTGTLDLRNNTDYNSAGYGILLTGNIKSVNVNGHRSINAASHCVSLLPQSGSTQFGNVNITGCRFERSADGYAVYIASGINFPVIINGNIFYGTTNNTTSNSAVYATTGGELCTIRNNTINGYAYGVWYNAYISSDVTFPWGGNQFTNTINGYRLSRSSGSANAKVQPNYFFSVTNRFNNGGVGSSCGTEELLINGVPVT